MSDESFKQFIKEEIEDFKSQIRGLSGYEGSDEAVQEIEGIMDIYELALVALEEKYESLCSLVLDYAQDQTTEKWVKMIHGAYDKWEVENK